MKSSGKKWGVSVLMVCLACPSLAQAEGVARSKAAELSLHRLERLVILKKIEANFQSKIKRLKLEIIPHQVESDPSFKSTIYQYPGADGTQKSLEVTMDETGKALKNIVMPGPDAAGGFDWPDKDPTTLCENAIHYVQDNLVNKPELLPYNQNFSEFSFVQGTNSSGAIVAVVDIQAGPAAPTLRVRMKVDGTFDSADFVPRTE